MRAQRRLGHVLVSVAIAAGLAGCSLVTELLPTPAPSRSCGSSQLSIDYDPAATVASIAGAGSEFVVAEVVGFEPAIFNTLDGTRPPGFGARPMARPDPNARATIYTPVNVVVDRAIKGDFALGPGQVLVEGGTADCFEMRVDGGPRLLVGSRYVLILADALDAEGRNPLPLPLAVLAWPVDGAGMANTVEGQISLDELAQIVLTAAPRST